MAEIRTATLALTVEDKFSAGMAKASTSMAKFQQAEALAARESARLSEATDKLSKYQTLDRKLADTTAKLEQERAALKSLGEQILTTAGSTKKLEASFKTAEERMNKTLASMERQKRQVTDLRTAYEQLAGGPLNSVASAQTRLRSSVEGATTALAAQRTELARVLAAEEKVAARRKKIAGMFSGAGMLAGPGILHGTYEGVKEGATVQHERVRLDALGTSVTDQEKKEIEKRALDLSAKYRTVTQADMMHMMRNAITITGSPEEAMKVADPMARLRVIADAQHPGQSSDEDFDQLIKGLEIKGVTQDPKQFHEYMNGIAKGLNSFGDTLKPYQYYEMFKYGRQATPRLSEQFMLGTAPALAQELGGSSYGNAISGFNQTVVGGRMKKQAGQAFASLGLVSAKDLQEGKGGEVSVKKGASVKGWELAQSDPYGWVLKYLMPALKAHHITSPEAVSQMVGKLFQDRTQAQLVSILATQQTRIDKDMKTVHGAKGMESADDYLKNDPFAALTGLTTSLQTFAGVLTSAPMKEAATMLDYVSGKIGDFTKVYSEWADVHPTESKVVGTGAVVGAGAIGAKLTYNLFEGLLGGGKDLKAAAVVQAEAAVLGKQAGAALLIAAEKLDLVGAKAGLTGAGVVPLEEGKAGGGTAAGKTSRGGPKLLGTISQLLALYPLAEIGAQTGIGQSSHTGLRGVLDRLIDPGLMDRIYGDKPWPKLTNTDPLNHDGNALRRNDEVPVGFRASGTAAEPAFRSGPDGTSRVDGLIRTNYPANLPNADWTKDLSYANTAAGFRGLDSKTDVLQTSFVQLETSVSALKVSFDGLSGTLAGLSGDHLAGGAGNDDLSGSGGRGSGSRGGGRGVGYHGKGGGSRWRGGGNLGKPGWWTDDRQGHAVDVLMKAGVGELGAKALVSRWMNVEAAGGPDSVSPKSGALGIAQGLGSRRAGYAGDFDAQLVNAARELHTTEGRALRILNAARTPEEAAIGASQFERAEGYNSRTGRDYFTNRTAAGIGRVHGPVPAEPHPDTMPRRPTPGAGLSGSLDIDHSSVDVAHAKLKDMLSTIEGAGGVHVQVTFQHRDAGIGSSSKPGSFRTAMNGSFTGDPWRRGA